MTTQNKHTPGPWAVVAPKGTLTAWAIESENQHPVAWVAQTIGDHSIEDANAAFIVRACNCHEELVAALAPFTILNPLACPEYAGSIEIARSALAKAKEEI